MESEAREIAAALRREIAWEPDVSELMARAADCLESMASRPAVTGVDVHLRQNLRLCRDRCEQIERENEHLRGWRKDVEAMREKRSAEWLEKEAANAEIARLRLTDAERNAIANAADGYAARSENSVNAATLRGLLVRLG